MKFWAQKLNNRLNCLFYSPKKIYYILYIFKTREIIKIIVIIIRKYSKHEFMQKKNFVLAMMWKEQQNTKAVFFVPVKKKHWLLEKVFHNVGSTLYWYAIIGLAVAKTEPLWSILIWTSFFVFLWLKWCVHWPSIFFRDLLCSSIRLNNRFRYNPI